MKRVAEVLHSITCRMSTSAHTKIEEARGSTQMGTPLDKNILVISDLHLGEDLRPGGANVSYLRHLATLERELERFLAHYTSHRLRRSAVAPGGQRRHGRLHVGDDPPRGQGGGGRRRRGSPLRPRLRRAPVAKEDGARHRAPPGRVQAPRRVRRRRQRAGHRRRQPRRRVPLSLGAAHAGRVAVRPRRRHGRRRDAARSPSPSASRSARGSITRKISSTSSTGTSTTSTARSITCCTRWRPIRSARSTRRAASRSRSRTRACATSPTRSPTTTRTPPRPGASSTT